MSELDIFYSENQIDPSCRSKDNQINNSAFMKDNGFDCNSFDNSSEITMKQIDAYGNDLVDKFAKYKTMLENGLDGTGGYEKKIKEGNKTEANEILLRAEVIKDDINTSISNIRDILYTQSCSMWEYGPKSKALTCNIKKLKELSGTRNQQKLAALELKDDKVRLYNESLIKIYLSLIVNGAMMYLIYKTLKQ